MVKENDGKQWWNRQRRRLGLIMIVLLTFCLALVRVIIRLSAFHGNQKALKVANLGKYAMLHDTHHPQVRAILEGKYFLIDLDVPFGALADTAGMNKTAYGAISASFCPLDWNLQKQNPSAVPMFRALVSKSKHCHPNRVTMDLREIVKKARAYDRAMMEITKGGTAAAPAGGGVLVRPLKVGGVAFHESRCGSTLVANLLVASNPTAHRVYSESTPPITALRACMGGNGKDANSQSCSRTKQITLLRDVVYLMSRSQVSSRETHVFFKIQSVGVQMIDRFTEAFPTIPWIFVYRDPVEVIMSHLKHGGEEARRAVCLRSKAHPPRQLQDMVAKHSTKDVSELTTVEFCAAHLATLCHAALEEYHRRNNDNNSNNNNDNDDGRGRFVNYATLPDIMWESILPNHFDLDTNEITVEEVERMKKVSDVYSKGFQDTDRANRKWEPDSETKQDGATKAMRKAAEKFLMSYYEAMEATNNERSDDDQTAKPGAATSTAVAAK